MKCNACGAEAVLVRENHYRCPYCTYEFDVAPAAPAAPVNQPAARAPQRTAPKRNEGVSVFEDNINGVLEITWNPAKNLLTSGSGLLIDKEGYALTNTHVVTNEQGRPCAEMNVKVANEVVKARVIRLGDNHAGHGAGVDLALIKLDRVPSKARVLTLGDFEKVRIGEQVFVIGNSLGDGTCMTAGIVSDKQRKIDGHTVLMTDCAINGGNSGGPIFNSNGEVIGVICSSRVMEDGSATEGMNYAIPINIVQDFVKGRHTAVRVAPEGGNVHYKAASATGPRCPKCKSSNTDVENGIAYCYDCDHEWGV